MIAALALVARATGTPRAAIVPVDSTTGEPLPDPAPPLSDPPAGPPDLTLTDLGPGQSVDDYIADRDSTFGSIASDYPAFSNTPPSFSRLDAGFDGVSVGTTRVDGTATCAALTSLVYRSAFDARVMTDILHGLRPTHPECPANWGKPREARLRRRLIEPPRFTPLTGLNFRFLGVAHPGKQSSARVLSGAICSPVAQESASWIARDAGLSRPICSDVTSVTWRLRCHFPSLHRLTALQP